MTGSPLPILLPLAFSATLAAWAMLSLLGSERERRLRQQKLAQPTLPAAPGLKPAPQAAQQRPTTVSAPRPAQKKN